MPVKPDSKTTSPEAQLRSFIDRFDPKAQKLIHAVRTALRKRFPTANELAYDYGHSVVISYSPTERGFEGIVTTSASADGLRLYFAQGPKLPDPKKLLQGSAKQVRFIPVEAASRLAHPDVKALMAAAVGRAPVPMPSKGKGGLFIRGAAAKKRPPRKPTK